MTSEERIAAIDHTLEEVKRVLDAVAESAASRDRTLEAMLQRAEKSEPPVGSTDV